MIQIIPGDGAGADNLAEIVDPVRNTVMAAGPNAEVDRLAVTPEDRMSVDARRACIARDIAGIVHSGEVAEKNPAGIGNCRILGGSLGFPMSYSQMTGLRLLLPAMMPVLLIALAIAYRRGQSFGHCARGTRE